jgi:hypothetical protein
MKTLLDQHLGDQLARIAPRPVFLVNTAYLHSLCAFMSTSQIFSLNLLKSPVWARILICWSFCVLQATPDINYAWGFYGKVKIVAGVY